MVKMPSRINFLRACGAFEKVDHICVMAERSLVGRLSSD